MSVKTNELERVVDALIVANGVLKAEIADIQQKLKALQDSKEASLQLSPFATATENDSLFGHGYKELDAEDLLIDDVTLDNGGDINLNVDLNV